LNQLTFFVAIKATLEKKVVAPPPKKPALPSSSEDEEQLVQLNTTDTTIEDKQPTKDATPMDIEFEKEEDIEEESSGEDIEFLDEKKTPQKARVKKSSEPSEKPATKPGKMEKPATKSGKKSSKKSGKGRPTKEKPEEAVKEIEGKGFRIVLNFNVISN